MLGLASAYLSNNNIEKAVETARLALERSPDDPELSLVMAEALVAKNQFAEAEPFLMKSLGAKPRCLVTCMLARQGSLRKPADTGRRSSN